MATGTTTKYFFPYPLSTDPVRVAGDIEQLATKIELVLEEEIQDTAAAMWTGGTFTNGINTPTYNDTTGKISMSLAQDIASTASPQFVGITLTGDLDVQGGDITTNQTTFNIINTTTTTLNIGGAATTINIGNSSGQTNFAGDLNIATGKSYEINNIPVLNSTSLGSSVVSSSLTSVGTISSGTWNATAIGLQYGGTNASLTAINGGIVYSTASGFAISSAGTSGQVLTSNGSSPPSWAALPGASTINISGDASGSGTDSITLTLANSGVTAATYGSATSIPVIQVDAKGRITSASEAVVDIPPDPLPQILMMAGM